MSKFTTWLFVLVLTIPLLIPLVKAGYPVTHDGLWAVVRQAEMHRELKDGQFPPRWSNYLNHGYGYPLFSFTYPLPYLLGEMFVLSGFGLVTSVKLLFALSVLGSAVSFFLLGNYLWSKWGGLVATAFYLYAPYRMLNLYVRGSLGESLAFVLYPLLFFLGLKLIRKPEPLTGVLLALFTALLITTHNISAILFAPFFAAWLLFHLWQEKLLVTRNAFLLGISLSIGVLLAAFFWLPALAEKQFIALSQIPLSDKREFFLTLPVFLGQMKDPKIGIQLTSGIIHLLGALAGIWFVTTGVKTKQPKYTAYFLGLLIIIAVLLLFPVSFPVWQLPLFKEIDFPWRISGVLMFLLSLLAGAAVTHKSGKYFAVPLIFGIIIVNSQYLEVSNRINEADVYFATNDATTTSYDELMPVWVNSKAKNRPANFVDAGSALATVINYKERSNQVSFQITSDDNTWARLHKLYFPGWKLLINGKLTAVETVPETGIMQFNVSAGVNTIEFIFTNTPVRTAANIASLVGSGGLLGVWILSRKLFPSS